MIEHLKAFFNRDLNKLKTEIESYQSEEKLWHFEKGILNSGGNLCLHLIGNLNAFIGVGLAKTNYVRNRDLEFSQKNIPKAELIQRLENTIEVVNKGLSNLKEDQLNEDFPIRIWEQPTKMDYTLLHLITHLHYHLGQVNYHRRLLDTNMSQSESYKRAEMPGGAEKVLDMRSLQKSNANLLDVLQHAQTVLDVGCGSGSITKDILPYVGAEGLVVGVDKSPELIKQAIDKFAGFPNLRFDLHDIATYRPPEKFDVISCSRVLQWMANAGEVITKLTALLRPGGIICVLDYNHTLIEWQPSAPDSMRRFYDAFLKWRSDAGMDNEIGNHVSQLLENAGLTVVYNRDQSEYTEKGNEGFQAAINIWTIVAETRGKQMVADNYITEPERALAAREYSAWCNQDATSMKLNLKAVHARI